MNDTAKTKMFSEVRGDDQTLETPERVLTIGAHPDDAEFGAGGTLAKWAAAGAEISMLIATDGSKGTWNPDQDPVDLIESRRREQRESAATLGATGELVFLDHVDGELEHTRELQEQLALWIRRLRPDVVLTFDPWKRYMLHPDHRAIGWAVVDAVVAARDHLFFPHQLTGDLEKHRPEAVLLFVPDEADHFEDIVSSFDTKIEALLCHSSQGHTTMGDAHESGEARELFEDRLRQWAGEAGRPAGLELAEAFKLIRP